VTTVTTETAGCRAERAAGAAGRSPDGPRAPSTGLDRRREAFLARTEQYRRLGYDRLAAARFVAEAAGDLAGPALDVGTGRGLLAMAVARRGLDVVTVDVSDEDRELAALLAEEAGLAGRIRFLIRDARSVPFPNGWFGCALTMDVLHHLEDALPILREMVRLVRPGGKVVVADYTEEGFAMVSAIHRREGREHLRSSVTVEKAAAILSEGGCMARGATRSRFKSVVWLERT
jgi:2-polyprenyl-3-methyl-5-hydroxy-6-metoxy-1,4-benzoquinol methylase